MILVIWIISAFIGFAIGANKGKALLGFFLGLLLGFIGVIIIAVVPGEDDKPKLLCPHCRQGVDQMATICPHCRSALSGGVPR